MTFYFYDLETSGINPRAQRIMQFAGQRTDENFNPIGEPQNWLVRLTDEILPDPDAVMITGITPQKTLEEGYSEAEFLELFYGEVLQPDTVIVGFNTVRFDDEFMRMALWRNFYDPYEWQWQDGRSRWDLLDAVRMIRALRPEGIEWPFEPARTWGESEHGKSLKSDSAESKELVPTNRLELLTKVNGLLHDNAHDALSDVLATISIAKLLKEKQPKIFEYLLDVRDKKRALELMDVDDPQPFVYTSGRYSNAWHKTTAVLPFAHGAHGSVLVYDLRQDPAELAALSDDALKIAAFSRSRKTEMLPVKALKPNACPAIAPLGVLNEASQKRIDLTLTQIQENYNRFLGIEGFAERLHQLYEQVDVARKSRYAPESDPDFMIYDGFVGPEDKTKMRAVRVAKENELADLNLGFSDERLEGLLPRYKARNFSKSLTQDERAVWEEYKNQRITEGTKGQLALAQFAARIDELAKQNANDKNAKYLLEELRLYAESVAPIED
jgi:exodeoxyribonuclease-1